jgi:hypothetical protein
VVRGDDKATLREWKEVLLLWQPQRGQRRIRTGGFWFVASRPAWFACNFQPIAQRKMDAARDVKLSGAAKATPRE